MIEFELDDELKALRDKTRAFIVEVVIPHETDPRQDAHGPHEELVRELQRLAAERGLLSPHVSKAYGGLGLDHRGRAVVFEEAGYSTLGSLALNVPAPDEGTEVTARAEIEAYEMNATKRWHECRSLGIIEEELLDEIETHLEAAE